MNKTLNTTATNLTRTLLQRGAAIRMTELREELAQIGAVMQAIEAKHLKGTTPSTPAKTRRTRKELRPSVVTAIKTALQEWGATPTETRSSLHSLAKSLNVRPSSLFYYKKKYLDNTATTETASL